ncbi:MAG TPA: hypothetical protein VL983_06180 [Terriglobales bacterium]|nr:hypothetical protein [Terriglobales bacterium]
MKKGTMLLVAVLFLLFGATKVLSQEKSAAISVKASELNNGVVILTVVREGKEYELQCNQGTSNCTQLKSGKYQMVELPKNMGMYDCRDVQIFADGANPAVDKKIGEYCLTDK